MVVVTETSCSPVLSSQDEDFSPAGPHPPAGRLPGQPQPQGEAEGEVQDKDWSARDGETESKYSSPAQSGPLTTPLFQINEEILRSETETLNNLVQIEKEEADVVNNYRSLVTGVVGQLERAARAQDL